MTDQDLNLSTNNPLLWPNHPPSRLSALELRGVERLPGPHLPHAGVWAKFLGSLRPFWHGFPAGDTLSVEISWFPGAGDLDLTPLP